MRTYLKSHKLIKTKLLKLSHKLGKEEKKLMLLYDKLQLLAIESVSKLEK